MMHYTPLKDRKTFQIKQLKQFGLENLKFIEMFDKESLTETELSKFNTNKLKLSEISLFKKHMYALNLIVKGDCNYNLIFEDDVVLHKKFNEMLKISFKELPNDYDMFFIGDGCNLHIPLSKRKPGQFVYKKGREPEPGCGAGATRCADSIFISKKCAKKICDFYENIEHINLSYDWWLNMVIRELKLDVYWLEPTIVTQGSESNFFKSSVR